MPITSSTSRGLVTYSEASSGRGAADLEVATRVERVSNPHSDMYDEEIESNNSSDDEREFDQLGDADEISDPGKTKYNIVC